MNKYYKYVDISNYDNEKRTDRRTLGNIRFSSILDFPFSIILYFLTNYIY